MRFASLADAHRWDLDGHLIGHGSPISVWDLEVPQMMAFVWWFFTHEIEEKDRVQFKARLWAPPPSERNKPIPAKSPWSPENEMKGFAALRAETGA